MRREQSISISQWVAVIAAGFFIFSLSYSFSQWIGKPAIPEIDVIPKEVDLGFVELGKPIQRVFLVRNIGAARLLITDVKSTCQCAVTELATRAIDPGRSVQLNVTFTAKSIGIKTQQVVLQTNDPSKPIQMVFLHAHAVTSTQP